MEKVKLTKRQPVHNFSLGEKEYWLTEECRNKATKTRKYKTNNLSCNVGYIMHNCAEIFKMTKLK